MATIWPSLMMVTMISFCGVCLSMPGDDRQESQSFVVADSSAHEGTRESEAVFMPSLDLSAHEPRLLGSQLNMLDFRSILELVLQNAFGLKGVLDKDSLLATDAVDESWAKWIRNVHKFLPVIPMKSIDSQNIENPLDDAPNPLWDYLLAFLLRSQNIVSVDNEDKDGDKEVKEENAVSYTTVTFNPIGQLFSMMKQFFTSVAKSDSVTDWWERVKKHFKTYSVFSEENTHASGKGDKDFGLGIFDYFTRKYTFGEHDLLKLAINFLIYLGFRSLFLRSYFSERVDDVESYPDYMMDYGYGDEEEDDEAEGDEEEGYMQNYEGEEEEGYNQYDYDQDEGQEEGGGYSHYDDGEDEGQEEEGYYQYDDDNQGEEEGYYQYDDNHQGGEESSYTHYGKEDQRHYQYNSDDGFNDQNSSDGQGFDSNAHQEVGHNANLGALKSAHQGLAEGANQGSNEGFEQGSNHGFDQSTNQGVDDSFNGFYPSSHQGESHGFDQGQNQRFDQSFHSSHQSSYQSYSESLNKDFDQNIPEGEENNDRRRHARDWPRPTYTSLSPEFNHGRNTYQNSNSQTQDDTHPSNRLRWSDIYKNNYSYQQGSLSGDSYWQQYPYRNSYTYERDTIYRNSYGQQLPYRNSYVYRRNRADNRARGPGDRRPHAATRSINIFGKK